MTLTTLRVTHCRNLNSVELDLHPHLNIVSGANGSGKTSLLEAIYLLGTGRSFRTREVLPLISDEKSHFTVFARTDDEQTVSLQKSTTLTQVRLNAQPCHKRSELAYFLPCQLIYQDIFQIIDAGPSVRRNILDWGMFHVKHTYHSLWRNYRRTLKQRNTLLKQQAPHSHLLPWDQILAGLANQLNSLRKDYFSKLQSQFCTVLTALSELDCSLQYYKGWDRKESGKPLEEILRDSLNSDSLRQFTQYGPHQADILIQKGNFTAKQYFSRGQQKIILIALKFAQIMLMEKPCLVLIDDLSAELDERHLRRVLDLVIKSSCQFFITAINPQSLEISQFDCKHFRL